MFGKKNRPDNSQSEASLDVAAKLAEAADVKLREDRIGRYLKKYMDEFVFDEFSDAYLRKAEMSDLMKGVPIPIRKEDAKGFAGGDGFKAAHIADSMAHVIGIDPHFKYTEHYVAFLLKLAGNKVCESILKKGRDLAEKQEYDRACIYFRATLCMNPTYLHGMYSYARVCRAMYLESRDEEYIGRFKAEALEYFELLTEIHPKYAQAYYFLGYAYLNIGLYVKAQLTWREFLKRSQNSKDKKEIRERLAQIEEPVEIEHGYNAVLAGRYHDGLDLLEPYLESKFKTWWPLSYYIGVCYARMGRKRDAIKSFKSVLSMNGSHIESMEELAALYAATEDKVNEKKYRDKIELIRKDMA